MYSKILADAVTSAHARVFSGCTTSCFVTEYSESASLLLATAILHIAVVVEKLPAVAIGVWRRRHYARRSAPATVSGARTHVALALMYLFVSAANMSLAHLYIDMPFQIVFRSSSVVFSIVCGRLFYGQSYGAKQYASCVLLSAGIAVATPYGAPHVVGNLGSWALGVALMFSSSAVSAIMGHEQRRAYTSASTRGQSVQACADEIMLVSHLVGSAVFGVQLWLGAADSAPAPQGDGAGADFLIAIAHYTCVSAVYDLVAAHGGLHCAFVLSLRKFASLLISVYYFENRFTLAQCIGTAFVALGTALFYSVDHRGGAKSAHKHRTIVANKQS